MQPEKVALLEKHLEGYPVSLDPSEVAEVLGCSRRSVDKLLDAGLLEWYPIDPTKQRLEKRVTKATLIAYLLNQNKGD